MAFGLWLGKTNPEGSIYFTEVIPLRIQGPSPFPQSIHMLKARLFFLKLQNAAHMGNTQLSNRHTHERGEHPLNWMNLGFSFDKLAVIINAFELL